MARIIENPKKLILTEAKNILYHEGYSKISIRRIAKECDIAVGTIYNYFPTKRDLIVEMMANFWEEYFYNIEKILSNKTSFYKKLRLIFDDLSIFIKRFRKVWLNDEINFSSDYLESSLEKQNVYISRLIKIIEDLLIKEVSFKSSKKIKGFDTHKLASFIVMNFISMIQMPYLEYNFFENLLKELIY